jgi:hypothetical protein
MVNTQVLFWGILTNHHAAFSDTAYIDLSKIFRTDAIRYIYGGNRPENDG